jgi:uncharacterized membrane protein (UPF0127 family)
VLKPIPVLLRIVVAGVIFAGLSAGGYIVKSRYFPAAMPVEILSIETARGPATFSVEIAATQEQQERGLMFRKKLAPGAGMLFDFGHDRNVSFWMKNTLIPLDMLFVRSDGVIVRIARNTKPLSERVIPSGRPVRAVLEIAGGRAAELGVRPGDRVRSGITFSASSR